MKGNNAVFSPTLTDCVLTFSKRYATEQLVEVTLSSSAFLFGRKHLLDKDLAHQKNDLHLSASLPVYRIFFF